MGRETVDDCWIDVGKRERVRDLRRRRQKKGEWLRGRLLLFQWLMNLSDHRLNYICSQAFLSQKLIKGNSTSHQGRQISFLFFFFRCLTRGKLSLTAMSFFCFFWWAEWEILNLTKDIQEEISNPQFCFKEEKRFFFLINIINRICQSCNRCRQEKWNSELSLKSLLFAVMG